MTPYHAMDGTTTEQILEEADILLAEFRNASQSRSMCSCSIILVVKNISKFSFSSSTFSQVKL